MPRLLDAADPQAPAEAAVQLAAGRLIGLPTETVYGLGADADQPAAVAAVFAAKGRPADHPLIVHLAAGPDGRGWRAGVDRYAQSVPAFAERLMAQFWPGPLTLILPRRPEHAAAAAGGQAAIGLRCPAHPVAQAVLSAARAAGVHGVAAPSANRFGRVSPTRAAHVMEEFASLDHEALLVIDGGDCAVGIESTIVDASRGHPVLLRPGMIGAADIERVAGEPLRDRDGDSPRASGTLASHYAPRARVRLMDGASLQTALEVLGSDATHIAVYARRPIRAAAGVVVRRMPDDAAASAHELFAALRELDARGVKLIWVETPPADPAWDGVRDRLQRAAA